MIPALIGYPATMDLLACKECSRQYDVTHLDPGDLVRCMCDTVISVPAHSPLSVTALSCTYCGGAVRPEDEACPYCQAKLEEKDRKATTLCPECYARIEDDARHCRGCGVGIRPQALTPVPDGKSCPRCEGELQIRSLETSDVIECADCHGTWIRTGVFDAICNNAERQIKPAHTDGPISNSHILESTVRYLPCLKCSDMMQRKQFRFGKRPSGVIIDVCRNHGVWLDHQELEYIVDFLSRGGHSDSTAAQVMTKRDAFLFDQKPKAPYGKHRPIRANTYAKGNIWTEVLAAIADMLLGW